MRRDHPEYISSENFRLQQSTGHGIPTNGTDRSALVVEESDVVAAH
jgi:hypothetical protein